MHLFKQNSALLQMKKGLNFFKLISKHFMMTLSELYFWWNELPHADSKGKGGGLQSARTCFTV